MKSKRIVYLDIIKIISIFAMMIIHVAASQIHNVQEGSYEWNTFAIYQCLTHFCVPIFFMCSGIFFLQPERKIKIARLYKHNIVRMISALLFWGILYAGYAFYCCKKDLGMNVRESLSKVYNDEFTYGHYHLWFLYAIIGVYIIVPLLRKIAEDKKMIEYFLIVAFVFCFCRNMYPIIPFVGYKIETVLERVDLNFVVGYPSYFLLGYYLHTYELGKMYKKILYVLGGISVGIMIIGTVVVWAHNPQKNEFMYGFLLPMQLFYSSALFIFGVDKFSKIKFKETTETRIVHLSGLTFGMYLVHDFFIMFLEKIGFTTLSFMPIVSVVVISAVVFVLSYVVVFVINKIPVLRNYII
ncbi:MAG: acyltransferase family protein [Lachnospiraceae bacterium]|nr:acyltransferase family protein [Lachnospiraceae bacterium]